MRYGARLRDGPGIYEQRRTLLSEFRRDEQVERLIERGVRELDVLRAQSPAVAAATF